LKKGLFLLFLFLFVQGLILRHISSPLQAQESSVGDETEDNIIHVIRNIDFDIKGRSRPYALLYNAEIEPGTELAGRARLEWYIRDKAQLLTNQRVLEDNVKIDYSLGEADENGRIPVDLLIHVEDTWNIMALPRPIYDSNDGLDVTIKARDYNFFGTMSPLRVDLAYLRDLNGENTFEMLIDSDIPFKAFGYNWNINFDNTFGYKDRETSDDTTDSLYYTNLTGLSMEMPYRRTTFIFGLEQGTYVNQENSDDDKIWEDPIKRDRVTGNEFMPGPFASTEFYASWNIPTGFDIGKFGELEYTPRLGTKINYRGGEGVDYSRQGPVLSMSHSLGFGRIDWAGNLRRGLEASLENSNSYNFHHGDWDLYMGIGATGHYPLIDSIFGISGRFRYQQWAFGAADRKNNNEAGGDIRGIPDKDLRADYLFSFNFDFPLRILNFVPSIWFGKPKLHFFDIELFTSPFLDLAFAAPPGGKDISAIKGYYAGGMEFIAFWGFMRSLYLRFSFGYDLARAGTVPWAGLKMDEYFIGIGLHY
jgi:hypothetical protein